MNPIVLTSKPAREHLDGIKTEYGNLIQRMQEHQAKVDAYRAEQQQNYRDQQEQFKAAEIERKKMEQENLFRQQEYDMKLLEALK
jgi:predicted phage gp36 major capsid-like protein